MELMCDFSLLTLRLAFKKGIRNLSSFLSLCVALMVFHRPVNQGVNPLFIAVEEAK